MTQSGSATISAASTSVTVTHGHGSTPDVVIVTPTSNLEGRSFWTSSVGATTFIINIDSSSLTDYTFDWITRDDVDTLSQADQLGVYVDTTGMTATQINTSITDATSQLTLLLDGSSMGATDSNLAECLLAAINIANRDPKTVRMGQGEVDYKGRIKDWERTVKTMLTYAKMTTKRG
jgi:hypothetical protein